MSPPQGKVAFVTGANGITGNAIVEHLIRQPKTEWSKIVITSRRKPAQLLWQDPRLRFIPLDLLNHVDEIIDAIRPLCADVTHAFFASYVHDADFAKLAAYNVPLFTNFLTAIDAAAGNSLQRICLHTGGKYYGAHLGPLEVPLHEGMQRYEDHGENFYYPQEDFLLGLAEKRSWDWNIIRPEAIIGFTPAGNGMSEALTLAVYMLCCREMGQVPLFPGNKFFYNCIDDVSYAPGIADMSIWAATSEHTKNEAFIHSNGDVFMWKYFWPKLGRYFGIDIPEQDEWNALGESERMEHNFHMRDWAKDKKQVWERVVAKHGGNPEAFDWGTWDFFDWALGKAWCTVSSPSKARKFGWTRFDDTYESYVETFHSFENAGVLPHSSNWEGLQEQEKPAKLPNPRDLAIARLGKGKSTHPVVQNGVENHLLKETV